MSKMDLEKKIGMGHRGRIVGRDALRSVLNSL